MPRMRIFSRRAARTSSVFIYTLPEVEENQSCLGVGGGFTQYLRLRLGLGLGLGIGIGLRYCHACLLAFHAACESSLSGSLPPDIDAFLVPPAYPYCGGSCSALCLGFFYTFRMSGHQRTSFSLLEKRRSSMPFVNREHGTSRRI